MIFYINESVHCISSVQVYSYEDCSYTVYIIRLLHTYSDILLSQLMTDYCVTLNCWEWTDKTNVWE